MTLNPNVNPEVKKSPEDVLYQREDDRAYEYWRLYVDRRCY